jgi:hypothetical protein
MLDDGYGVVDEECDGGGEPDEAQPDNKKSRTHGR